jgi:hypothetical protein
MAIPPHVGTVPAFWQRRCWLVVMLIVVLLLGSLWWVIWCALVWRERTHVWKCAAAIVSTGMGSSAYVASFFLKKVRIVMRGIRRYGERQAPVY